MAGVVTILFVYLCILCLLLLIPVLIGIYVYRDASRRKMNAVLWTLVAAVTPVFVGLVIYLLVRAGHSDLECPSCGMDVTEDYTICPRCGTRLKSVCDNCGFQVEEDWVMCPRCAKPLEKNLKKATPPVHHKDKALWKLLLAIVFIPVLFFILLCGVSVSTFSNGISSSMMSSSYTLDEIEGYRNVPKIWNWMEESREKDPEGVYVLHYEEKRENNRASIYLIYRPSAGNMKEINMDPEIGPFKKTLAVSFKDTDDPKWDHAYYPMEYVAYSGSEFVGLDIIVDGENVDFEMTEIDFDPILDR